MRVDILMSTYNGAKYIGEQIESIIGQSYKNWRLIVRDDGSKDSTIEIVKNYSGMDSRVILCEDNFGNLKPSASFLNLLSRVDSEYFMFCDQDDVWLPDKIKVTVDELRKFSGPHLVCSDLHLVDGGLNRINQTFWERAKFDPLVGLSFRRLAMQNIVVGCTIGGNLALISALKNQGWPDPKKVVMHDWWLALFALAFGRVSPMKSISIEYRQHGGNVLGAQKSSLLRYFFAVFKVASWKKAQSYLSLVSIQAKEFLNVYKNNLCVDNTEILELLSNISRDNLLLGVLSCFRKGVRMQTWDRNVGVILSTVIGRLDDCWRS